MSGYVNGQVLDTLSEHANALASSAVASLEDEADRPSHFPFLPTLSDFVLTVPRHHGWYREGLVIAERAGIRCTCAVVDSLALCSCGALLLQAVAQQISAVHLAADLFCSRQLGPTLPFLLRSRPDFTLPGGWATYAESKAKMSLISGRSLTLHMIQFHKAKCMHLVATYTLDLIFKHLRGKHYPPSKSEHIWVQQENNSGLALNSSLKKFHFYSVSPRFD